MQKDQPKIKYLEVILIAFLTGVTLFSFFKYVSSIKERSDLLVNITRKEEQAAALEAENKSLLQEIDKERQLKEQLVQESAKLKSGFKANEKKLAQLEADFASAQKTIEDLYSSLSIFKVENTELRSENDKLKLALSQACQAKDELEARLNSFTELKKAIRELKIKMRKARKERIKGSDLRKAVEGNRGFLIKDGQPTYPAKITIEVAPLPVKE